MEVFKFEHTDEINWKEYARVFTKVSKVLRPDLDKDQRAKLIEMDWKKDSQGQGRIGRSLIFQALFELADIWTPDISANQ